jgi:hypothetical protein
MDLALAPAIAGHAPLSPAALSMGRWGVPRARRWSGSGACASCTMQSVRGAAMLPPTG